MSLAVTLLGSLSGGLLAPALPRATQDDTAPPDFPALVKLAVETPAAEMAPKLVKWAEFYPTDLQYFVLAMKVADEAAEPDLALWFAESAIDLAGDAAEHQATVAALESQVAQWDTVAAQVTEQLTRYEAFSQALFLAGRAATERDLHVNAVDLLTRCQDTRFAVKADRYLTELYANPAAQTAMVTSGVDVPAPAKSPEVVRRIAELDAQHADWDHAYEVESDNYLVKTDMGVELAEQFSVALEQMNLFYRKVFEVKGKVARCSIHVYRSRDEFDEYEGKRRAKDIKPEVKGFYSPGGNYVATYDPRTDGFPYSGLWSTLFHEASHQFTHEAAGSLTPGWLNEGTASYFEGAKLLPNKSVLANGIPRSRLWGACDSAVSGKPKLEDVVRYHQPGSYAGDYYPVGWGLVYFLHNYQDDKGRRPYLAPYQKFLDAYRKEPKEDAYALFEKLIVQGAKQKGCASFAEFDARWKTWIQALGSRTIGGLSTSKTKRAADWVEVARGQLRNKDRQGALESYRFALDAQPRYLPALFELGDLYADLKQRDASLYMLRQLLGWYYDHDAGLDAEGLPGKKIGEVLKEALARVERLDKVLGEVTRSALYDLPAAALTAAAAYEEGGLPRRALRILDDAITLLGGNKALQQRRDQIAEQSKVDVRRWRRLSVADNLLAWHRTGDWWAREDAVEISTKGTAFLLTREPLPRTYRLEATVELDEDMAGAPLFGLVFRNSEDRDMEVFAALDYGSMRLMQLSEGAPDDFATLDQKPLDKSKPIKLRVDVSPRGAEFFVGDKRIERRAFEDVEKWTAQAGLFVDALDQYVKDGKPAELVFKDLRVFY